MARVPRGNQLIIHVKTQCRKLFGNHRFPLNSNYSSDCWVRLETELADFGTEKI